MREPVIVSTATTAFVADRRLVAPTRVAVASPTSLVLDPAAPA